MTVQNKTTSADEHRRRLGTRTARQNQSQVEYDLFSCLLRKQGNLVVYASNVSFL